MKKILFFILLLLLFTSCEKEQLKPIEEITHIEEKIYLYGEWTLLDGKMYVENLETRTNTVYNHFDENKTTSSLRYSGSRFEIENLEANKTTWTFIKPPNYYGYGEFLLNNDTLNPFGFYVTEHNWTIIEHPTTTEPSEMQLGGSSRPISATIDDYEQQIIIFHVQETYENINGYNCFYYSELRFKKL